MLDYRDKNLSKAITPESSGLYFKSFTIVILDCNDNVMYYKTMIIANLTTIVANLALARSINWS